MNNLFVKIVSAGSHDTGIVVPTEPGITTVEGLMAIVAKVFQTFFGLVIALATIYLLYAAFQYIVARGDETKVEKAKNSIIWTVVALIIAILAFSIPTIISNFLGGTVPTS